MRKSCSLRKFTAVLENGTVLEKVGTNFGTVYNWFVDECNKLDTFMQSVKVEFIERAEYEQLSLFA